jgi:hypothetical protein
LSGADADAAPFTLHISFPVTAAAVATEDNALLVAQLREGAEHLRRHALPALAGWRAALAEGLGRCGDGDGDDDAVGVGVGVKRPRNSSSSSNSNSGGGGGEGGERRARLVRALREVVALETRVQRTLRDRIAPFLESPPPGA